jgi:hypothetical protein
MGGHRPVSSGLGLFRIAVALAVAACAGVAACGAGDTRIDPGDLELRDLLGIAPGTASSWDEDQRASARRVLEHGLATEDRRERPLAEGGTLDDRIARTLVLHDAERARGGDGALGLVRIDLATTGEHVTVIGIAERASAGVAIEGQRRGESIETSELWISERWTTALPGRGLDLLADLAREAGHPGGPVVIAPGARLPVIASYVVTSPPRLIVNPVLLAAQEPEAEHAVTAELAAAESPGSLVGDPGSSPRAIVRSTPGATSAPAPELASNGANPYSFYGSIAECAYAQRTRCESCLSAGNCEAITRGASGTTECNTFAAEDGRGYFLICVNLALAISSVQRCAADAAPGCPRDVNAANELSELENNAGFLDNATCGGALDRCLAEIYGPPDGEFPGPGGPAPPRPPRSTNVSCVDSCDSNNCEANASCGEGPSCNNSLSCDSACSSSNDQSGCGGNCNACTEDSSGSGGSSGCGGSDSSNDSGGGCSNSGGGDSGGSDCGSCSSDSGGGGGGGGGGCGGDSGGGSSGGSCGGGGDSGGGGSCGGDSSGGCGGGGGGGCGGGGGGGCGGGSGGGSCGSSGGGSSGCNTTRRRDGGSGATLAVSLLWSFLPIPAAAWIRRRARRSRDESDEVSR